MTAQASGAGQGIQDQIPAITTGIMTLAPIPRATLEAIPVATREAVMEEAAVVAVDAAAADVGEEETKVPARYSPSRRQLRQTTLGWLGELREHRRPMRSSLG
jgi:hypothetical protein